MKSASDAEVKNLKNFTSTFLHIFLLCLKHKNKLTFHLIWLRLPINEASDWITVSFIGWIFKEVTLDSSFIIPLKKMKPFKA